MLRIVTFFLSAVVVVARIVSRGRKRVCVCVCVCWPRLPMWEFYICCLAAFYFNFEWRAWAAVGAETLDRLGEGKIEQKKKKKGRGKKEHKIFCVHMCGVCHKMTRGLNYI